VAVANEMGTKKKFWKQERTGATGCGWAVTSHHPSRVAVEIPSQEFLSEQCHQQAGEFGGRGAGQIRFQARADMEIASNLFLVCSR
jgi:hypothetical protein